MAYAVTRRGILVACTPILAGCSGLPWRDTPAPSHNPVLGAVSQLNDLELATPAFEAGGTIPEKYGKAHQNVNPPLSVRGVPDAAETLAFLLDDPDAPGGTFIHWLVWNIPPNIGTIPEGWTPPESVSQGTNDFGNVGYDGPKPPSKHTYRFKLFAVDTTVDLSRSVSPKVLGEAMDGHILAQTQLTGTFAP